jgi:hypothetical protein
MGFIVTAAFRLKRNLEVQPGQPRGIARRQGGGMKRVAVAVACFVALCALTLVAQSASNDPLGALLVEVRLLRQALERNAAAPQIQLLGTRLQVQNRRLQAATKDHEVAREVLREAVTAIEHLTLQESGDEMTGAVPPDEQKARQRRREAVKEQLSALRARGRLRTPTASTAESLPPGACATSASIRST